MRCSILSPGDGEWARELKGMRHDFYQLPGYAEVCARHEGGEPVALRVEGRGRVLLLPLLLRPIEDIGEVDAASPYGYPGFLTNRPDDEGFEREALLAGIESLRELGAVSLFIRLHPLLNPSPSDSVGTLVRHGHTVAVDLSLPDEVLWNQIRRNHRQQIRQAREAGYVAGVDPGWARLCDFKRLYRATMEMRSASAFYHFTDDYFEGLRLALGPSLHLGYVELDRTVAAAALFVETDGIVQMHLTGHDVAHSKAQPMKLLFDHIRTWSRARGNRWLHLGGGRGSKDDSLFHFKAGFSPLHQPYFTRRVVIDEDRYRALVAAHNGDPDHEDRTSRFPLYRD